MMDGLQKEILEDEATKDAARGIYEDKSVQY
jgi:hypothetical protein